MSHRTRRSADALLPTPPGRPLARLARHWSASRPLLVAIAALLALACGGGGGSSDGGGSGTGSTSVFLTDAPSDEFDRMEVTFEEIRLIGGGPQVMLYTGEQTVDLKDLEDFSDLFVYAEKVPARAYSKIRLVVRRLLLVEEGRNGRTIEAEVPSGKIDIIPEGKLVVREGVNLVIELDMDARRSVVHTGNDRYKFIPVIKATVRETVSPDKLARVHGEVTDIFDDQSFELCSTIYVASLATVQTTDSGTEGGLGDRHRCMTVETNGRTGVFDPNGDPVPPTEIMLGDSLTVVGKFHLVDTNHDPDEAMPPSVAPASTASIGDLIRQAIEHRKHFAHKKKKDEKKDKPGKGDDDDSDDGSGGDTGDDTGKDDDRDPNDDGVEIVFFAYVVEIGVPGTFDRVSGTVASTVDANGEFDLAIGDGSSGGASIVAAQLQDGTRIFAKGGFELAESAIVPGTPTEIDGVFASPSRLKTALVVLDIDPDRVDALRGRIVTIDDVIRRLLLDVDDMGASRGECVDVPETADIFLVRSIGSVTRNDPADFGDLEVGQRLEVFGRFDGGSCFVADTILAFSEVPSEEGCRSNDECGEGEYCATSDGACSEAGLCLPRPTSCGRELDPVCGCDDETYGNPCQANMAGASIASAGACPGTTIP
jgi:hypothetical protein